MQLFTTLVAAFFDGWLGAIFCYNYSYLWLSQM
jgi:hypothetical protein